MRYLILALLIGCAPATPTGFVLHTDDPALKEAATRAVDQWNGAYSDFSIRFDSAPAHDGEWTIELGGEASEYAAGTYPDEGVIRVNAEAPWYYGVGTCYSAFDYQTMLEHEIGHSLGLHDTWSDRHDVMYGQIALCERRHEITKGDMQELARNGR